MAASFQAAVVKMLVRQTVRAALRVGRQARGAHGRRGRQRPSARGAGRRGRRARHPRCTSRPPRLCTDNAAMITAAGTARLRRRRARPARRSTPRRTWPSREREGHRGEPPAPMNFQAVLAGLPDAVIAVDDALRVVFWNAAAEVLTERSARRAEGRLLKEVFAADASLVRRLSETLATGESRSEAEGVVERPDHRAGAGQHRDGAALRPRTAASRRRWRWCAISRASASSRPRCGAARRWRPPVAWRWASPTRSATRSAPSAAPCSSSGASWGRSRRCTSTRTVLLTEVDRVNRIIEMLLNLARPVPIRPVPLNLHQLLERVALLQRGERARPAGDASCGGTIRACRRSSATRTGWCRCSTTSCATRSRPWPTAAS